MARISLRPEFRFSREPGACQEASKGMNPCSAGIGNKEGVSKKRGRSLPAVSNPARRMGLTERCLRRGTKKGPSLNMPACEAVAGTTMRRTPVSPTATTRVGPTRIVTTTSAHVLPGRLNCPLSLYSVERTGNRGEGIGVRG